VESVPEADEGPVEGEQPEETLSPSGVPGPMLKEAGDAYLAHLRVVGVERALLAASTRVVDGLVTRLGGQRLLVEVPSQELAEFGEALEHGAQSAAGLLPALEGMLAWWGEQGWLGL
jgi:hypothetical protein